MTKPFKTLDEQIEILINRNLIIDDPNRAKYLLTKNSYYSVINGYKGIFLKDKENYNDEDCFEENTTLEDIINLYHFDKKIRNEILSALENVESTLSANIAYIFAERFGDLQSDYLNPSNFKLGRRVRVGKYERDILLDDLNKICMSDEHPMKHYRENHGNIPPWIIVKGVTFGNIRYIYKLFKKEEKEYLISRCLGISESNIDEKLKEFFSKMLDIFRKYRNWAAHGGRLYSHKVSDELPYYLLAYEKFRVTKTSYDSGQGKSDILALCVACSFFLNSDVQGYISFAVGINFHLKQYSEMNPKYYLRVIEKMGIPISHEEILMGNIPQINPTVFLEKINYQGALSVLP